MMEKSSLKRRLHIRLAALCAVLISATVAAEVTRDDFFYYSNHWLAEDAVSETPFYLNETAYRMNLLQDTTIDRDDILEFISRYRSLATPTPTSTPEPPTVMEVDVLPERSVADIGEKIHFAGQGYDGQGVVVVTENFAWSSTDQTIVSVSQDGVGTPLKGGNTWINAEYERDSIIGRSLFSVNPISAEHNSRPYEWYRTQMNTGYASSSNCGPTSTHMAIKWHHTENVPSVEEIRNRHPRGGGWWYVSDIRESLTNYGVPYATHYVDSTNDILACLQRGNIVLLCVEMGWVSYNRHAFFDRFYTFSSGHFLIVKGYSENDDYFVVYDPNSWSGDYYSDGTMMGRNRFYNRTQLLNAVTNWWSYCLEISAPPQTSTVNVMSIPDGHAGPREYGERK